MIVFVIKKIRENKNISLYKLSKMTELSRTYLRKIENNINTNPTISVLEKIASALDVNIKDLFYSKLDFEQLRQIMHEKIDIYGIDSKEALEISHIIDLILNINGTIKNN